MYSIQNLIQLENYNGVPLVGGKVYVYHQGRTELATIYSDYNGATPIANPATLDALGMQEIYVSQRFNYTVVVTDPYGNELFSRDIHTPINSISGSGLPYEGIYPINVDNTAYSISADTIPFGIQEPLYFVKDDAEGMIIGMSGEYIPQSASGQFVPTSMMDLYASKAWVNNQGFITGIPESATWNTVTGKVDTTAFDNYSADVSSQIDYVSANAGTTYSAGANIDITDDVISGKDWTDSITGASAYSYNEAVAQIPTDYATTAQLADKLDTAVYATDSGTFLTAHQALPQSADWDSAASTVSAGYTNWDAAYGTLTANSANWDSTYTTVSNNSASWTGGSTYTGDAQGALDEVYSNSANWNSTYTTVSDNSASWTGGAGGGLPMNIGDSAVFDSGYEMNNEYSPSLYLSGNMYNYPLLQVRGGYNTEGASGALRSNYISFHTGYTTGTNTYQVLRLDRDGLTGKATNYTDWYFRPYEYGLLTGTYDTVSNNSASWGGGSTYTGDAQGALDEVYSNSGTWNSTTTTVSTNSGAWGGSGIEISAGFGIDIQMVDNKLLISLATATGDI